MATFLCFVVSLLPTKSSPRLVATPGRKPRKRCKPPLRPDRYRPGPGRHRVGGLMFAFGEGGAKRTLAGVVFGVGMAVGAVNFMAWLFP